MGPFSNLSNNRQIPWHLLSLSSWNKGTQLKGHHWGIHRNRKKPLIKSMPWCPGLVCDLLQQKNPSSHPARSSPQTLPHTWGPSCYPERHSLPTQGPLGVSQPTRPPLDHSFTGGQTLQEKLSGILLVAPSKYIWHWSISHHLHCYHLVPIPDLSPSFLH